MRLFGTNQHQVETFPVGQIKRVRLIKRANGFDVQFAVKTERQMAPEPTGRQVDSAGGLKSFCTDAEGQRLGNPRYRRQAGTRLKRLHRRLARQQTRSKHRTRAIKRLAKGNLQVSRQRQDLASKTARALILSSDMLAYEHLQMANMVKNPTLAKRISDASWGLFRSWLGYHGRLAGIPVVAVSPRSTTQDCSGCAYRVQKTLSVRTHICPHCGLVLGRDENAALNVPAAAPVGAAHHRTAGQAGTGSGSPERSRFRPDRHDALCSQAHEAFGLDERSIPRIYAWRVSIDSIS